eukprot:Unigene7589_Nuclearia_a/m.23346 Unigene7589_Nuclearia_a/g.23346  ORF Unigene7589_Nuclearia_a/g.23346 Unigene7589_Nuclearia_a/m.23346 type:complete len:391 (-) Unigene7589_Nuclearia_a:410-1582(-)
MRWLLRRSTAISLRSFSTLVSSLSSMPSRLSRWFSFSSILRSCSSTMCDTSSWMRRSSFAASRVARAAAEPSAAPAATSITSAFVKSFDELPTSTSIVAAPSPAARLASVLPAVSCRSAAWAAAAATFGLTVAARNATTDMTGLSLRAKGICAPRAPSAATVGSASMYGSSIGSCRKCRTHCSAVRVLTWSAMRLQSSLYISMPSSSSSVSWSVHCSVLSCLYGAVSSLTKSAELIVSGKRPSRKQLMHRSMSFRNGPVPPPAWYRNPTIRVPHVQQLYLAALLAASAGAPAAAALPSSSKMLRRVARLTPCALAADSALTSMCACPAAAGAAPTEASLASVGIGYGTAGTTATGGGLYSRAPAGVSAVTSKCAVYDGPMVDGRDSGWTW